MSAKRVQLPRILPGHCVVCGYQTEGVLCVEHFTREAKLHKLLKHRDLPPMPKWFRCSRCQGMVWERERTTHECPERHVWRQQSWADMIP